MATMSEAIFLAMCKKCPSAAIVRAVDQQEGLFWHPSQNLELACLNFEAMLAELFLISKSLLPKEVQKAMQRFDEHHGHKLVDAEDSSCRSLRNQSQGILNLMSYINKRRRNMKDGSRMPDRVKRLIECSRQSPDSCSSNGRPSISPNKSAGREQSAPSSASKYDRANILAAFGQVPEDDQDCMIVEVANEDVNLEAIVDLEGDEAMIKDKIQGSSSAATIKDKIKAKCS